MFIKTFHLAVTASL